jgi:hypothetical protein
MKSLHFRSARIVFIAFVALTIAAVVDVPRCDAQWGYHGRGSSAARGAFRYRGPILTVEVGPAYPVSPWAGGYDPGFDRSRYGSAFGASPYDRYRMSDAEFFAPNVYDRYRGIQPTPAELDRERYYHDLDRMHRYQTREERYENDFRNAYTPSSAMVNRYRQPYVAGTPAVPWTPMPVPGLSISRHESRYQGYVADEDVAVALRAAAMRLRSSLERKADGHIWIRHLQPDLIIDAIDRGDHPSSLTDLVVNYEGVADNPRLVLISESNGFKDVRRLLAQYVTLSSPYPNAEPTASDAWQDSIVPQSETIIDERPLGEQVLDDTILNERVIDDANPILAPAMPTQSMPVAPAPEASPADKDLESLDRPSLDSVPDEADVELLPPPAPDQPEAAE